MHHVGSECTFVAGMKVDEALKLANVPRFEGRQGGSGHFREKHRFVMC